MLDQEKLKLQDCRRAAIHEAGHAVMMTLLGQHVEAAGVWPNDAAMDDKYEKHYVGQVKGDVGVDVHTRRRVGLAGLLAEALDEDWQLLRDHWPAVLTVAALLEKQGHVDGPTIGSIVQQT
jgi:hypothetical protein